MSTFTHGMDLAAVRERAAQIDGVAGAMRDVTAAVDRIVDGLGQQWSGRDMAMFQGWWREQHRPTLAEITEKVAGLAQAARNNADEQEGVSGGGRSGGSSGAPDGGGSVGVEPPVRTTIGSGEPLPGSEKELSGWMADYRPNPTNPEMDTLNFGYNTDGNCTSYVGWRLNQLASEQGLDWSMSNNHVGDASLYRLGNAHEWGSSAQGVGFPPDQIPAAGAVAWWDIGDGKGWSDGDFGHVGVVRSLAADGTITVEESSWGSTVFKVETYRPGDRDYPGGFLHLLPGT